MTAAKPLQSGRVEREVLSGQAKARRNAKEWMASPLLFILRSKTVDADRPCCLTLSSKLS
jgi:hypothetical protein